MTITVKKIALSEQTTPIDGTLLSDNYLNIIGSVEVGCTIRIGSLTLTIDALHKLKQGQILTLDQKLHEPLDILLNNQVIARGELMSAGDCFAVKVTEVASQ
ncbi:MULTISPECIES: FliM/FliN family flagellar motor switch protein [unclassified Legionella]|uniref:FliM/FliN family flagellar motor switch protein n=1 Tax=unclassified Legionella TaxID=2622702 RepID=UPI001056623C|nr:MULTISPECIES: FliM/FliN family flagellar motor switch protein [unclassified Legionella]MDI9817547.1 FliM/FliN family flagellar motor switch protein [Legionella sp. PL877]